MIAHPLISMPKEFTPPHVSPAATAAAENGHFARLLDPDGIVHLNQSSGTSSTPTTSQSSADAQKQKTASGDDSAASAAVTVPVQLPPVPPKPGDATTAAAATQAVSSATAAQTAAAAADAATGSGTAANSQSTQLPPEAAALGARVAAGVPNYLSQPSSVLAGLWHHGTDAGSGGGDKAGAADEDTPAETAATLKQSAASTLSAETRATAGASVDPASGADASTAATPDASTADTTQAATFALPQSNDQNSAPAPAATANAPPPPPTQALPVFDQVAVSLKQAAQNGSERIEIQLKPASLGAINVKLDVTHDGHITAVISADRSDTLHMLRQDASGLEQALRDAGLQADSGSLSFNLRGDAQSFAQNQSATPSRGGGGSQSDTTSAAPIAAAQRMRRHDGALDIQV